ncbi:MAG: leucine-rich repeat protein [Clostridia bacterium]|nr:leucine-rich repeat protein [Clostridia bacterium]
MHLFNVCKKPLAAFVALAMTAALVGCAADPDISYGTQEPTLSDDELPAAWDGARPTDTTDYQGLAHAVFENIPVASGADFTYESSDDGLTLTAYTGAGGVLVLPDEINGTPVTALGDRLFKDNTAITALAIPDSVVRIGQEVLNGCRSLQVLKTPQLGETRQSDGYLAYLFGGTSPQLGAFKVGSALDTVILTDALTSLDTLAFYGCYRLIMVLLPDTLTEIGSYAFSGCSALKYVRLPDALTTIGDGAFSECGSLQTLTIPDSVTQMGLGALMSCTSLVELSIPFVGQTRTSNTHLGYIFGAQSYTWNRDFLPSSLQFLTVRSGDISNYAFYECDGLYSITLPESCTQIGVRAFHGCTSLRQIALPDSITHIGDMAFSDCRYLTSITMGDNVVEIGMQAFMDCINLTEITLSDEVTMLSPSLFSGCKRLASVTVSDKLTTVDDGVFHDCISLTTVRTHSGNTLDATKVAIGRDNAALENCLNP